MQERAHGKPGRGRWIAALLMLVMLATTALGAVTETRVERLRDIAERERREAERMRGPRYEALKAQVSGPQALLNADPDVELVGVHPETGVPVYYETHNADAALTTRTAPLHPGGESGFNLTGAYTTLMAIWDAGAVLNTHSEFGYRVSLEDNVDVHSHATHVAGTMVAEGLNFQAMGMSPEAMLTSYDWNSDNSEMAAAAADDGIMISNHSYGRITGFRYADHGEGDGWYWFGNPLISETQDYGFGFYGPTAEDWDEIAYNAPHYLICKSAGNDRGDGPSPGSVHYANYGSGWEESTMVRERDGGADGYDCVSWYSTAKNILTVGAVNDVPLYTDPSSVSMSSFSGWGPTDDGRIKPDIVANGVQLTSTSSSGSYSTSSGTSMAAPNASGTINLLYNYYQQSHGYSYPLAATMKALVLHTADECGAAPGPDYKYGWGLINAWRAAELIQEDSVTVFQIQELVVEDGDTLAWNLESNGSEPGRLTIAWTDPPGVQGPSSLNDTTPKLINDLDLRLISQAGDTTYQPWVLDVANPALPAVTGDNRVDNVEQVFVADIPAGSYTARLTHKGVLDTSQAVSLVISGFSWTDDPREPPTDFTADLEWSTGTVNLSWSQTGTGSEAFEGFRVYRNGTRIATVTEESYTDELDDFGIYDYEVRSLWSVGESVGNPVQRIWWTEPVPPRDLRFTVADETASLVEFSWAQVRAIEQGYDDDSAEEAIVLGPMVQPGARVGVRMDVPAPGRVISLRALVSLAVGEEWGPITLVLAGPGEGPGAPGPDIWASGEIVPDEAGWVEVVVPAAAGNQFATGDTCWAILEWNQPDATRLDRDTSSPYSERAYIATAGNNWEPLDEAISGYFVGNPLLRAGFGNAETVGENGLTGFSLLEDGEMVGSSVIPTLEYTLPSGEHEYAVRADYEQGSATSEPLVVDGDSFTGAPEAARPLQWEIGEPYPNPFNPTVTVPFTLAERATARVVVFDLLGREVAAIERSGLAPGRHRIVWDGAGAASGVYILRVQAGPERSTRKVVLMR